MSLCRQIYEYCHFVQIFPNSRNYISNSILPFSIGFFEKFSLGFLRVPFLHCQAYLLKYWPPFRPLVSPPVLFCQSVMSVLSVSTSVHQSVSLLGRPSVSLSVHQFISSSVRQTACLSVYPLEFAILFSTVSQGSGFV